MEENGIQIVVDKIADEISKSIFQQRLNYFNTSDDRYIHNIVQMLPEWQIIKKRIDKTREKKKIIWGAGYAGRMLKKAYPDVEWTAFADRKHVGKVIDNLPVIEPNEIIKIKDDVMVFVGAIEAHKEIYKEAVEMGIQEALICDFGEICIELERHQYFDLAELKPEKCEVFIDAGCYNGDTITNFIDWKGDNEYAVIGFESDSKNYNLAKSKFFNNNRVEIMNKGVWEENTFLFADDRGTTSSRLSSIGTTRIQTLKIDSLGRDDVSFIKMDIEGAEKAAIKGAEETIKRCHPKLAICVYHESADFFDIPKMILEIDSTYRIFFRHYSFREAETVMYAI